MNRTDFDAQKYREQDLELIKQFRPIDDTFMRRLF